MLDVIERNTLYHNDNHRLHKADSSGELHGDVNEGLEPAEVELARLDR